MESRKKSGCLIDISRFRVPTMKRMKDMMTNLAAQGHSIVFFNIEHVFKTALYPKIGSEADGFTEDEFREIDRHAALSGIEIIPSFQSFGHMFHILKWDEYEPLSETEARWSICISDESYKFLDGYYGIITRAFSSKYLHIGCDEIYDMFDGRSRGLLREKTKNELFYEHIINVKKIANKYGRQILIWGDMVEKDADVLQRLGDQVGICYWMYDLKELPEAYHNVRNDIYVCSGNNAWKSFFPRIKYAVDNMRLMFEYYNRLNAHAFMITDWGDGGHFHPASFTEKLAGLGRDIFDGKNVSGLDFGNEKINVLVDKMDELHCGNFLNALCLNGENEFYTQMLFYEFVFTGSGFAYQSDGQIEELIARISGIKRLDAEIEWKPNEKMSEELMEDLRLFVGKTLVFGKKVGVHYDFRKKRPLGEIRNGAEELVISLRRWFAEFMKRWLSAYQPMGLYFHIHFMKMIEINTINELKYVKTLREYDYAGIEKKHIYDIPEYTNIREVCNIKGLNELWKNFML